MKHLSLKGLSEEKYMKKRYKSWAGTYGGDWRAILRHPDRFNIITRDLLWVLTGRF